MEIAGREITPNLPPFIVAEISGNHVGELKVAYKLIEEAKKAGADAVKVQCYQADTITLNCDNPDFIIKDGPWKGRSLYELYKRCETPRHWFPYLFKMAQEVGVTLFSSVFSPDDVDFLESLGCPAYKIASMEITDVGLIEHAAKTGKPIIISTGMATDDEVLDAWKHAPRALFLQCTSGYPTPIAEAALRRMTATLWGLSDHTLGSAVPIAATALGACMIEKHLRLGRHQISVVSEDDAFSMAPHEFQHMAQTVRQIWQAMQPSERKSEESSKQLRRSLYAVQDIKAGEPFTAENVRSIRPCYGLPPADLPKVLGSKANMAIAAGTALRYEMCDAFFSEKVPF